MSIFKPSKTSLSIIAAYFFFLILVLYFPVYIFLYTIEESLGWLNRFPESAFFIIGAIVYIVVIYLAGQVLALWLARYQSTRAKYLVYGFGTMLSVIALALIIPALYFSNPGSIGDPRVLSNVKQTQVALELYKNDAGRYPEIILPNESIEFEGTVYMQKVPRYFGPAKCREDYEFFYQILNNAQSYELFYCLENANKNSKIPAGVNIATPGTISVRLPGYSPKKEGDICYANEDCSNIECDYSPYQ